MIKYRGKSRKMSSESYDYGTITFVIQSDLKSGAGKYRVFRLDSHTGSGNVVAHDLTLRQARKLIPYKLPPRIVI